MAFRPAFAAAALLAVWGFVTDASADVIASSTFDTDAGGWTVGDIDNTSTAMEAPTYHTTGGNPGGYISTTDDYGIVGFFAPSAFIGDQSGAYGGTLSFDLEDEVPSDGVSYPALILYGNGQVISAIGAPPSSTGFSSYSIALNEVNFDFYTGSEAQGRTAVTQSELQAILGDLTGVAIEADWHTGDDLTDLDNVVLSSAAAAPPPSETPEPASLALIGVGIAAIGAIRRRR